MSVFTTLVNVTSHESYDTRIVPRWQRLSYRTEGIRTCFDGVVQLFYCPNSATYMHITPQLANNKQQSQIAEAVILHHLDSGGRSDRLELLMS
ncbi:hypothetical protein F0562_034892 [Nyssa sinensis]|uniref:Uncharacterized protein n=1 Tax=Nyssa sinensis TaxID=561372 RepID=A0A5J5A8X4_9ASTE|nr:hypothetical protein F0562_034892 [Nyssa sinensis]